VPADRAVAAVNPRRLLDTAVRLIAIPSPTGDAGACADALADLLRADGFVVARPDGGHPAAPAVVCRLDSGRPGPCLQFDGHLDTVHLPFVPPAVVGGRLTGSGACDMKAGVAAAVEALRALRDADALPAGSVLLVAHDLHEAPWGFGQQLDALILAGLHGDAILIPEYQRDWLPTVGRGSAVWEVRLRRPGPPVREVVRPEEPSVIAAGAELALALERLDGRLATRSDPAAGPESVFIGQLHAGEIYNQYPQECRLEGTRRWLPDGDPVAAEAGFRAEVAAVATRRGLSADVRFQIIRHAFRLDEAHPFVAAFLREYAADAGQPLPTGPKRFVDDGNSFWGLAGVPAVTHGPRGGGAHTVEEWVELDDLARVARLYARTAVAFCGG
jgi:acetylornithine deacetylase/succinyl-diaminopimelate desuccinylase-like protein